MGRIVGQNANLTTVEKRRLKIKAKFAKIMHWFHPILKWIFKHLLDIIAIIISLIALTRQ